MLALTDSGPSPQVALAGHRLNVAKKSEAEHRSLVATMVAGLGLVVAAAEKRAAMRAKGV